MRELSLVFLVILLIIGGACAAIGPVTTTTTFDFIVVGAGASGSIVATRLANETGKSVLLLEGGEWGTGQRALGGTDYVASSFKTDPVTGQQTLDIPFTRYDVPTMSDTIRGASNVLNNMWPINASGVFFSQAKVIGGNQATNGMAWFATQKADYDAWNVPGFSSAEMWPIAKRIENATETGYGNSPDRGNAGPISVEFTPSFQMEQKLFYDSCRNAGYQDGGDMNDGSLKARVYQAQSNVKNGVRESTSVAYLAKVLGKLNNLELRAGAIVTKVLFDKHNVATGVTYFQNGVYRNVFARLEVILASGSLQTTKILYHSGIGPESVLKAFNIQPRVVNNIIGQQIRNHQRVSMIYSDVTGGNANWYGNQAATLEYASKGTGLYSNRAFYFVHFNSTNPNNFPYPDLQASPNPYAPGNGQSLSQSDAYAQQFVILVGLNRNKYMNGTLNLTSSDPLAATRFVSNMFVEEEDVQRALKGIAEVRRIMSFWPGRAEEVSPGPSVTLQADLINYIKTKGATSFCHYYGTTPLGTDISLPCDPRMKVRGVRKLRLVGPTIIPVEVYSGMQVLATILGEKGADLILEDHGYLH